MQKWCTHFNVITTLYVKFSGLVVNKTRYFCYFDIWYLYGNLFWLWHVFDLGRFVMSFERYEFHSGIHNTLGTWTFIKVMTLSSTEERVLYLIGLCFSLTRCLKMCTMPCALYSSLLWINLLWRKFLLFQGFDYDCWTLLNISVRIDDVWFWYVYGSLNSLISVWCIKYVFYLESQMEFTLQ